MKDRLRSIAYRIARGQGQLIGLWERFGDSFAGCAVLIESTPEGLRGRITYVPCGMRRLGWRVGDVKWTCCTAAQLFAYQVLELYKEVDRETGELKHAGYVEASIGFMSRNEFVVFPRGRHGVRVTHWRRTGVAVADCK